MKKENNLFELFGKAEEFEKFGLRVGNVIDEKYSIELWEDLVPITSDGNKHRASIMEVIGNTENYAKFVTFLSMLTEKDTLTLFVTSPGGNLDSGLIIYNAIKKCKAKITGVASGTVASAATIILMACDDLIVDEYTGWLSHNYSGTSHGKGAEIKARQEFDERLIGQMMFGIYKDFMTDSEIKEMRSDKDFWFDTAEIKTRWKKVIKARKKAAKKDKGK